MDLLPDELGDLVRVAARIDDAGRRPELGVAPIALGDAALELDALGFDAIARLAATLGRVDDVDVEDQRQVGLGLAGPRLEQAQHALLTELAGDGQAIRRAERALVARMGRDAPVHEDVHGIRIASVEGPLLQPRWAFHDDLFVISTHESAMRATVERLAGASASSFADLDGVSNATADLSDVSIVSVTRTRPLVDSILNMLRSFGFAGMDHRDGRSSWLASTRLPSPLLTPDLLKGYLVQSVKIDGERFSIDVVSR